MARIALKQKASIFLIWGILQGLFTLKQFLPHPDPTAQMVDVAQAAIFNPTKTPIGIQGWGMENPNLYQMAFSLMEEIYLLANTRNPWWTVPFKIHTPCLQSVPLSDMTGDGLGLE